MEFPNLGQNCFFQNCNRLDFLPLKCDACNSIFCKDHFEYDKHYCANAFMKNNQVPLCPLCNQPVPVKKGEPYDFKVNQHIENDCQDDRVVKKRKQIYKNRCQYSNCKQKEMIPIICQICQRNYCLRHRHPIDHSCKAQNSNKNKTLNLLVEKDISNFENEEKKAKYNKFAIQGYLNEDEALALALQKSLNDTENKNLSRSIEVQNESINNRKEKCTIF